MARQFANSLLDSLKGKIQIAAGILAFFVLTFGFIACLILSFVKSNSFFVLFIPFLLLAGAVVALGWWLAGEIIKPIDKISLLAKSLERGTSVSLPKTSGSYETDELLKSLQRSNQQLQNLVNLMEKVANGELDVALAPLENSDRLSISFQKLLAKVSESIDAQQNLESLQNAAARLVREVEPVKNGKFDVEITTNSAETGELAETFVYLTDKMSALVAGVKRETSVGQTSINEARRIVQTLIQTNESAAVKTAQAKLALKQIPQNVRKISEELANSATAANRAIETARGGTGSAQENLKAVNAIRKQMQESVKRVRKLGERAKDIEKVAKTVEDLSHRTNMIALNASLQAAKTGAEGGGFSVIAEEIERLAVRADNTNKQISSLNKTIAAEIGEVEHSLQTTISEAVTLSKYAIETGNSLGELEKYAGQFLNLQSKLIGDSNEKSILAEESFRILLESINDAEIAAARLKESDARLAETNGAVETLAASIADYKPANVVGKEIIAAAGDFAPPTDRA